MSNGPRNLALPAVLATAVVAVGLALFALGTKERGVEALPQPSAPSSSRDVPQAAASVPRRSAENVDAGPPAVPHEGSADDRKPLGEEETGVSSPSLTEIDTRAPAESPTRDDAARRNVIAGGARAAGERRPGTSGGGTSGGGSGGSVGRGGSRDSSGSSSSTDSLTVFAEQPAAGATGGAASEGSPAEADGEEEAEEPAPIERESDTQTPRETVEDDPAATRTRREEGEEPEPTATPVVRMVSASAGAIIGDAIPIGVQISGGTDVGHVPFHVKFDPGVVRFEYGEEGFYLGQDGKQTAFFAAPTADGSAVVVGLSRLGRVEGVAGGGELCTLVFTATGPGDAAFAFARAKVRDSSNRIVPSIFQPLSFTVRE